MPNLDDEQGRQAVAKSNWFKDLTPATPARAAARQVLATRVSTVEQRLGRMTNRLGEKPEDVHKLRVATRRLAAGLSVFRPVLCSRLHKRLRRAARRIRRAAGAVRDLDVLRVQLEDRLKARPWMPSGVGKAILRGLDQECRLARRALAQVVPRWAKRFSNAAEDLLASLDIESPSRSGLATKMGRLARVVLGKRLNQLFAAGRADLADLGNMHRLRIAAKRLRYAMEVFAGCYPTEFRGGVYQQVESIQSELGAVNDLKNLVETLLRLQPRPALRSRPARRPATGRLIDQFTQEIGQELRTRQHEFSIRWTKELPDLRRRFRRFLARQAII